VVKLEQHAVGIALAHAVDIAAAVEGEGSPADAPAYENVQG
jgi:hypothetical protein